MLNNFIASVFSIVLMASAVAAPVVDPLQRPALKSSVAEQGVFQDIERQGGRLIAVGERGLILLSDDDGINWRQAKVPVSVTLTAVDFSSAKRGWAVGHSGVVLHTEDGGETWSKQLDGVQAASLAMDEAQSAANANPESELTRAYLAAARWLVKDGADKPFLDVHFMDEKKGFIVGAYGLFFTTEDGGVNWSSRITTSDNPQGMNLYSINSQDGNVYVAGEQGFFAHSVDGVSGFKRIDTPYQGSWFVITATASKKILLGGLRGNAYLFDPLGNDFSVVNISTGVSFNSALMLNDGRLLFVDQAGRILQSQDDGDSVYFYLRPPGAPLIVLAASAQQDTLIGGGFGGLSRVSMKPAQQVSDND